ncbi:MAG: phosphodiesterase [Betaproteobacteria bacterium]|nr:phosphodiesterase [Betaproteobacteria bacterium]NBY04523.1 phosphodiesterase [Betaproteobacteria bacterium]
MLIAQFSDTHIKPAGQLAYGVADTHQMLQSALDHLQGLPQRPDLLVITGDLVDAGSVVEYQRLQNLLNDLPMPYLLIAGNHDDRDHMRQVFPHHPWLEPQGFWQYRAQASDWPFQILALDTVNAGESGGRLCPQRLNWFAQQLEQSPHVPTLVMMHHPPFATGIGHMDAIGLADAASFADILRQHPQIDLVICGHLHRNIRATVGGRAVMTAPSTAHTVQLDVAPDAGAMFRMEPPAYLMHWWSGTGWVTHHVNAVQSPGPYPFFHPDGQLIMA